MGNPLPPEKIDAIFRALVLPGPLMERSRAGPPFLDFRHVSSYHMFEVIVR